MRHRAFLAGKKLPTMYAKPFGELQWFPERLEEPLRTKKPHVWAVGFQTDLFHWDVLDLAPEWLDSLFSVMALGDGRRGVRQTFLLLTKRPENLLRYLTDQDTPYRIAGQVCKRTVGFCPPLGSPDAKGYRGLDTWAEPLPLPNVYLGVTVCTQAEADRNIPLLLQTPAAHRWISIEPMLEAVDLSQRMWTRSELAMANSVGMGWSQKIDGVILGAESGPGARPMEIAWARSIRDQCAAAGVSFFLKQMVVNGKLDHAPLLDGQAHRALAWGT
jgi:protein gp37